MVFRAKVVTDAKSQLLRRQYPVRFSYCSLAMHPLLLDVVEPSAFSWHKARNELNASYAFSPATEHLLVMLPYPVAHFSANVPRGVVPDKHQHPLALRSQAFAQPTTPTAGRQCSHGSQAVHQRSAAASDRCPPAATHNSTVLSVPHHYCHHLLRLLELQTPASATAFPPPSRRAYAVGQSGSTTLRLRSPPPNLVLLCG